MSHAACADTRHSLQAAAQSAPDPLAKLRALVLVQYRRSQHLAALIDLRPADPHGCHQDHESEELYEALHTLLGQIIAEGQRAGAIRPGDPRVLAAMCLELISPRAFQNIARVAGAPEEVAEHIVAFALHGLSA